TSAAASMTAAKELIQASLSWLDRKKASSGYARWLSSTMADQRRHSSNVSLSAAPMSGSADVSSSCTAEAPARASSATTDSSRDRNAPYSSNRTVMARAASTTPFALSMTMSTLAPARSGTKSP